MRLQSEVDVDHAELIAIGPGGEIPVLLGLEPHLACLVPEHLKGLLVRHLEQLGAGAGTGLLRLGDLARLLVGDIPPGKRLAHLPGFL
jgi:hypothetical protein